MIFLDNTDMVQLPRSNEVNLGHWPLLTLFALFYVQCPLGQLTVLELNFTFAFTQYFQLLEILDCPPVYLTNVAEVKATQNHVFSQNNGSPETADAEVCSIEA